MIDFIFHYLHRGAHTWGKWYRVSPGSAYVRRDCGACMRSQVDL